jgi:hypothetical protein
VFPSAFKRALIHPVYKEGGKARSNPASYRPVAILCALSKVLETVAKEDLEAFMKANDVTARLQEGEVMHHCARHSPCGCGSRPKQRGRRWPWLGLT